MAKLSTYARTRIVNLRFNTHLKVREIREILSREDGIAASESAIYCFLRRYRQYGSLADRPRSGRPSSVSNLALQFIDTQLQRNNEITAAELQVLLENEFGNPVPSLSTIKRSRHSLGWRWSGTKYCQLIRDANKPKRLEFCQRLFATREQFGDVIFSDECTVEARQYTRKSFRKLGQPRQKRAKPKHPLKVHVWAGISLNGASDIAIFTGIMDSEFYQQILQQYLLPFIANKYPDHHRFQQDNDPKHTSHSTRAWMTANHVNHWPTPPESPDLNPIENLWAKLKHHLSKEVKPRTKEQLVAGIKTVWRTMTPDVCRSYIGHLGKVIPAVIANNGNASGY